MRVSVLFAGFAALLGAPTVVAAEPIGYTLTDLGPVLSYDAPQINNSGQVTISRPDGPVMWSAGVDTPVPLGSPVARLLGLNDYGDASGYFRYNDPAAYVDGATVDLNSVVQGRNAHAVAINDVRKMVLNVSSSGEFSYVYDHGSGQVVQLPGRFVTGMQINNSDEVVGSATPVGGGMRHAFHWAKGTMTLISPPGSDGTSAANAINDIGTLVGTYEDISDDIQPFLRYSNGEFELLPLVSETDLILTLSINQSNVVVGRVRRTQGGYRAVVWEDGRAVTLTEAVAMPGWVLETASDINDAGQIVGVGVYEGVARAYLLNPVPGPGAGNLLLLTLCTGARRRSRGS